MKMFFLGTNGWFSTKTGNTICTLLETEKNYIVFDAGDALFKLNKHVKKEKPIYLFLSHVHIDHITGFHSLCLLNNVFHGKFYIIVPKGYKKILNYIISHPLAAPFDKLKFEVIILEFEEGGRDVPFFIRCNKLFHIDLTFGYRIEVDDKSIAHCLDTGECENSLRLAKNADVLIHECSNKIGKSSGEWGHSDPLDAARLAEKAGVKKLFLTHFSPNQYEFFKDRKEAEREARKIFKNTWSVKDDLMINI
jgi:ribonuclease Z